MLAFVIALLFTITGVAAVLTIADSMMKARRAYRALMAEAALLRDGFACQIEARAARVERTALRATPVRYAPLALPACAVA
jgi:hypothetical protein